MSDNVQPIFILPEGAKKESGKQAQRNNIMAAKLVAETVRTTLGPKGMDKMLVDSVGDVVVTNDGITILEEMNVEHPAAKMVVEVAKTQEKEVGDGTTTAVVLAGELLKKAEFLLDQNIHPTVIAKGYRYAEKKVQEVLNDFAKSVSIEDAQVLRNVAMTAMTGKGAENSKEHLANLAFRALRKITTDLDRANVKIESKTGLSVHESELIEGVVLDKERIHSEMPQSLSDVKILLLNSPIEVKSIETNAKIQINNPEQMQAFLDMEERMVQKIVTQIIDTGAKFVACQKGIDELAQYYLAKNGIYAVRRVKKSDLVSLSKATGAKIITHLDDFSESDLGFAGVVEEAFIGSEKMTLVKECKSTTTVTVVVRGSTEHVVEEIKRAMEDVVGDMISAVKKQKVVSGAGSCEIELAKELRKASELLAGRERLAVQAFSEAMEVIPRTLAENAGLDPIDILASLKSEHDLGNKYSGINVFSGKMMNAWEEGVIEPLQIKTQAISSATEVAVMILRIDDVIAAGKHDSKHSSHHHSI
jgi:archaeal chaperonin